MPIDYKQQWNKMTPDQRVYFLLILLIVAGTMLAIMN